MTLETETKRPAEAEAMLSERLAYVRLILSSTAQCFYALTCDGTTTLCNPAFLRLLGFADESEAVGRRLHDVIHHSHPGGAHYPVDQCPIYHCAKYGTPAHIVDEFFYRLDGTPIPVEYWAYPIVMDGVHVGAICTFNDVTERRQAAEALRASESQFRTLAQAMPNHVWTASAEGRLDWFNSGTFSYSGLAPAELHGDGWTRIVHPDDVAAAGARWASSLGSGAPYEAEFRLRPGRRRLSLAHRPRRPRTERWGGWHAGSAATPISRIRKPPRPCSPTSTPSWKRRWRSAPASCWPRRRLCGRRRRWRRWAS